MALIGICTILAILCGIVAIICLRKSNDNSKKHEALYMCFSIIFVILMLSIYIGVFVYIAPMYSLTETKTVEVCDKFTTDGVYNIATNDGKTTTVDRNVYGFIPAKGNATLDYYTDGFFGTTTVTKIYSNTTCQVGCLK